MNYSKPVCECLSFYPTAEITNYEWLVYMYPYHHKFFTRYVVKDNSYNIFGWTK